MKLLKKQNAVPENLVIYAETSDYIIGCNTKDSSIISSGYCTFNIGHYLGSLKTITNVFIGSELLASERYVNVIDLFNIENDKKYIILELYSSSEEHLTTVYIFDNKEDYYTIKGIIEDLFIHIGF